MQNKTLVSKLFSDDQLVVYCVDIGSETRHNFAWAKNFGSGKKEGTKLEELVDSLNKDIKSNKKIALGFECPLFIELANDYNQVCKARRGEGNRSWSASAGAQSLVTGLGQISFILNKVNTDKLTILESNESNLEENGELPTIYIWEAFITNKTKFESSHLEDCKRGIKAFIAYIKTNNLDPDLNEKSTNYYSIIGSLIVRIKKGPKKLMYSRCIIIKA